MLKAYNVLSNEAHQTHIMKVLDTCYLDYKSHYPNQRIMRNLSKMTLYGRIVAIIDDKTGELILTTTKTHPNYIPHLGGINLSIANNDIITYGNIVCNLPSLSELTNEMVKFDSEPKITPDPDEEIIEVKDMTKLKPYKPLLSLLRTLNTKKFSSKEKENDVILNDNTFFLINNGKFTYYGNLIEYEYLSETNIQNLAFDYDYGESRYGTIIKDSLIINNNLLQSPVKEKYKFKNDLWKPFPLKYLQQISEATLFSTKIELDNEILHLINKSLYFPFKHYFSKLDKMIKDEKIYSKVPVIDDIEYMIDSLKSTFHFTFRYKIFFKDIIIQITQTCQAVKLNNVGDEGDMLA